MEGYPEGYNDFVLMYFRILLRSTDRKSAIGICPWMRWKDFTALSSSEFAVEAIYHKSMKSV